MSSASSDLELSLHLTLSPYPASSPEKASEPPIKRRKLNSLKVEARNKNEKKSRRKRKLPLFATNKKVTTKSKHSCNKSKNGKVKKMKKEQTNCNRNNQTKMYNTDIEEKKEDTFHWNQIAATSLMTIFEYINAKYLYLSVCKVCKLWSSTIFKLESNFIFGYFRKTMHMDPNRPLTLTELKKFNVSMLKQELKARHMRPNGKKQELINKLHKDIKKDALAKNAENKRSIANRKRLIWFQIKQQLIKGKALFCQNCHTTDPQKTGYFKKLGDIHLPLKICASCSNLLEFQDVNVEHAMLYYGLNQTDFRQCGIKFKKGRGQTVNHLCLFYDEWTNAYVCQQIAKMKYGVQFERRKAGQVKGLQRKNKGKVRTREDIFAPHVSYVIDKNRFKCDELLFNATLS